MALKTSNKKQEVLTFSIFACKYDIYGSFLRCSSMVPSVDKCVSG